LSDNLNQIVLCVRHRGDGTNGPGVTRHNWNETVSDVVANQLFDKLPQWLDVPSEEECDWRDQALRDDPDVRGRPVALRVTALTPSRTVSQRGACPPRPADHANTLRRQRYGAEVVNQMLSSTLRAAYSSII
jgi:hypothetical protein